MEGFRAGTIVRIVEDPATEERGGDVDGFDRDGIVGFRAASLRRQLYCVRVANIDALGRGEGERVAGRHQNQVMRIYLSEQ